MEVGKGKSKKSTRAAKCYRQGRSRGAYCLRKDISEGLNSTIGTEKKRGNLKVDGVCADCSSLTDFCDIFYSFVSSGRNLKRRMKAYSKPHGSIYRNVKEQNNFLLKSERKLHLSLRLYSECFRCWNSTPGSYSQSCSATKLAAVFAS